jgi:hypothetical protein
MSVAGQIGLNVEIGWSLGNSGRICLPPYQQLLPSMPSPVSQARLMKLLTSTSVSSTAVGLHPD